MTNSNGGCNPNSDGVFGKLREIRNHLLTPKQVSELLGVAENTLAQWRQNNPQHLPFLRLSPHTPGKHYRGPIRYRVEHVLRLLESCEVGAQPEADRNDPLHGMQRR